MAYPIRLFILLLVVAIAYLPGLHGPFVLDDFLNIVENSGLAHHEFSWQALMAALTSGISSTLSRPLSQLTFAMNFWISGPSPFGFKLTNLCIHLFNSTLVYLALSRLTKSASLALVAAAIWSAHPLQLTSVLYTVQRMNSLATTVMLLGICVYLQWRSTRPMLANVSVLVATAISILFKETGICLPAIILLIEFFLLRPETPLPWRKVVIVMFALIAILSISIAAGWWDSFYLYRNFSVSERMLGQPTVLLTYIKWFLVPDIRDMGIFHDDWQALNPFSGFQIVAILLVAFLVVASFVFRRQYPLLGFGILWFFIGHALESSPIPLEMMFEHRNYFPSVGLALILSFALQHLTSLRLKAGLTCILIFALSGSTFLRSYSWGDSTRQALSELKNHPYSERAHLNVGGLLLAAGDIANAKRQFLLATQLNSRSATGFVALVICNGYENLPVAPELIENIKTRIESFPLDGNTVVMFKGLMQCQVSGDCQLDQHQVTQLLRSATDSPKTNPAHAVNLATMTAIFALEKLNDFKLAESYYLKAIQFAPKDSGHYLNLSYYYLKTGQYQRGLDILAKAQALDRLGSKTDEILYMQKLLLERKTKSVG